MNTRPRHPDGAGHVTRTPVPLVVSDLIETHRPTNSVEWRNPGTLTCPLAVLLLPNPRTRNAPTQPPKRSEAFVYSFTLLVYP